VREGLKLLVSARDGLGPGLSILAKTLREKSTKLVHAGLCYLPFWDDDPVKRW
jgi:hypothetical protein